MKKVAICLKNESKLPYMKKLIQDKGLVYVTKNPDFAISLGGDGSFLFCERKYPGVPKLLIKDSKVCKKCVGSNEETILDFIRMNAYDVKEESKIEAVFNDNKLLAINDLIIRNKTPNQAIRLALYIDNKKMHDEIIGDGLLIATSFGSTAYFKSITGESFEKGFGVAFSNPVSKQDPLMLTEGQIVKAKIVRGEAQIAADNDPIIYSLKEGDSISVRIAKEKANIISIEEFE